MELIVVLLMGAFATWAVNRNRRKGVPPGTAKPARLIDPRALLEPTGDEERDETLFERKVRLERELDELEARRSELRSELLSVKNKLDEPGDGPPHR